MNYWQRLRYKQNLSLLQNTTKDLLRKKLVPEYTKSYILDNIPAMAWNRTIDRVKWLRCPQCNIEVPSRMLMHQHLKYCRNTEKNLKENENITTDTKVSF